MASPQPKPQTRADAKAIEPRCICTGQHTRERCPRLVVPESMKSREPNQMCRWCGQRLGEMERFYHEGCSAAAEGRL